MIGQLCSKAVASLLYPVITYYVYLVQARVRGGGGYKANFELLTYLASPCLQQTKNTSTVPLKHFPHVCQSCRKNSNFSDSSKIEAPFAPVSQDYFPAIRNREGASAEKFDFWHSV